MAKVWGSEFTLSGPTEKAVREAAEAIATFVANRLAEVDITMAFTDVDGDDDDYDDEPYGHI